MPLPSNGGLIGNGPDVAVSVPGVGMGAALYAQPSGSGYAVEVSERSGPVLINGHLVASGQQVLLNDGDVFSIGGQLIGFRAGGNDRHEFTRTTSIEPINVGGIVADRAVVSLGRSPRSTIVLAHPTVALHHAEIRKRNSRAEIHALDGSVSVNGEEVSSSALVNGDEIAIGPYRITFDGSHLIERHERAGLGVATAGLTVTVAGTTILQPTNLAISPGELVALIGESGAGKSTLMNVLAGVKRASGGRVQLGGESPERRRSEIGYVPQFDMLHDGLTLYEALDYAARLRLPQDTATEERRIRINEVLAQLSLTQRANLRIANLSGGQRKRAAVGIELLANPGIIFLDEPTTGLDPGLERQMMTLLRSLADSGQTIVLVTHATGNLALCDRVVLMARGGRVRFDGEPQQLLKSFGISEYEEVYGDSLDRQSAGSRRLDLATAFQPGFDQMNVPASPRVQIKGQGYLHQTTVLTSRYVKLMSRDRRHLISTAMQVPVLALVASMLFPSDVFEAGEAAPWSMKSAQLLFVLVIISGWLGALSASREIVKERSVLARELMAGLKTSSYLTSKLIVLTGFVTAQIVVLSLIAFALRPLSSGPESLLVLTVILVSSGVLSTLAGLIVSATARSEDQATGLIPLLLVPQLLLSGAIVTVKDMSAPVEMLATLIPSRWAFEASGTVIDLNSRFASDPKMAESKGVDPNPFGPSFFDLSLPLYIWISMVFAVAMLVALFWLIDRARAIAR